MDSAGGTPRTGWRHRLHEIVFEAETRAGRAFDVGLLVAIVGSLAIVSFESVAAIRERHGAALWLAEWGFTILFTFEYLLRLASVVHPLRYARSFFGVVDLLAILPTYLSVFLPGAQALLVIRSLRLLRVFRILKLVRFVSETQLLLSALRQSRNKIIVFVTTVLTIIVITGALMYVIEGPEHGFVSVPTGMYWAVVTLTTVGFGDLTPQTSLGRLAASAIMLLGYGILAVPTGIFSAELIALSRERPVSTEACPACSRQGHDRDASFCKFCGATL